MSEKRPTEEAYAELQQAYDFYNRSLFNAQLPPCLITFQRQKKTFGYFSKNRFGRRDGRTTDEIAINPEYFAVVPLFEVLQTLVHEMTHLWQEHFGKPSRSCYHNAQWASKMESIGLMPSDTGLPGGKMTGQSIADYTIAGGAFEQASKELLATGFAISWLDRYPAKPPDRFLCLLPAAASACGVLDTGAVVAVGEEEDDVSTYDDYEDLLVAAARRPPSASQPHLVENQKDGNRSNRNKYTCPVCALNVWGKPGLRIICGECEKILLEGGGVVAESESSEAEG